MPLSLLTNGLNESEINVEEDENFRLFLFYSLADNWYTSPVRIENVAAMHRAMAMRNYCIDVLIEGNHLALVQLFLYYERYFYNLPFCRKALQVGVLYFNTKFNVMVVRIFEFMQNDIFVVDGVKQITSHFCIKFIDKSYFFGYKYGLHFISIL